MRKIGLFTTLEQQNVEKIKMKKKLLNPENKTHKAKIYKYIDCRNFMDDREVSTLELMEYCCNENITDFKERTHELKRMGLLKNRIVKTKDGKSYAMWKVVEL